MTNKQFAEKIITRIESHKENVKCPAQMGEGYALAHDHIKAIVEQELRFAEELDNEKAISEALEELRTER